MHRDHRDHPTATIRLVAAASAVILLAVAGRAETAEGGKPNVLFIAVDDLRPQLGCYGQTKMHSPNIDRLASQGVLFRRAYCMVPTCGASRASLMTGIRPARNRFVNYLTWAERDAPGVTTLNTHFRNHGYTTISNGKVFHHPQDNAAGWSEPAWRPERKSLAAGHYALSESRAIAKANPQGRGPAYESADVPDETYGDGMVAQKAVADLRRLKGAKEPFFLAVGFFKPHLPFVAPTKYWNLYPADEIHLPANYHRPQNAPDAAIHNFGELRSYAGIPKEGPVSDETARALIRGYYASVSYTDAQIGKVLDELDRLGLAGKTIVILWGDHGWNLGEHTLWCKHCTFETSMRIPLVVRAPGIEGGASTDGLTETIDVYPSLCELAGLPAPDHLQGKSFVFRMRDPDLAGKASAIGRYRAGDTVRTDQYRFTEYTDGKGKAVARMLYDHRLDPGENVNISEQPQNEAVNRSLVEKLHNGMGKPNPQ